MNASSDAAADIGLRVAEHRPEAVSFLGSAALSALFDANELATQQHRALRLVCNSPIANWALAAAGLREYFIFADTVSGALKYPACRQRGIDVTVARRLHRRRRPLIRDSKPVAPAVCRTDW